MALNKYSKNGKEWHWGQSKLKSTEIIINLL